MFSSDNRTGEPIPRYGHIFERTCYRLLTMPLVAFAVFAFVNPDAYLFILSGDRWLSAFYFCLAFALFLFAFWGMALLTKPDMDERSFRKRSTALTFLFLFTILPGTALLFMPSIFHVLLLSLTL